MFCMSFGRTSLGPHGERLAAVSSPTIKETDESMVYAAVPEMGLSDESMSQSNICVYFTDLQALKQLYELAAEHWHRRAEGEKGTRRGRDDRETEIELEQAKVRPTATEH